MASPTTRLNAWHGDNVRTYDDCQQIEHTRKEETHDFTRYVYTVLQKCLLRNNNIRMIVMRLDCVRWVIPDGLNWYLSELIYHENMCYIVAFTHR